MARKKKKANPADHVDYDSSVDKTLVRPALAPAPNRYGAQAIYNEAGDQCCCHMAPLTEPCPGCDMLSRTKRQPTLAGVDDVRMNPPNDDGDSYPCAMTRDGKPAVAEAIEDGLLAEDGDDLDMYPEDE